MSPLRWIQSTGPHWTVMLEEVTSDKVTLGGGIDGAVCSLVVNNGEDKGAEYSMKYYTNQQ